MDDSSAAVDPLYFYRLAFNFFTFSLRFFFRNRMFVVFVIGPEHSVALGAAVVITIDRTDCIEFMILLILSIYYNSLDPCWVTPS